MKYGIYYAYWESQWGGDFRPYVERVKELGFDILEIACATLPGTDDKELAELKALAAGQGVMLTAGHGPAPSQNIASADPAVHRNALAFYETVFGKLETLGVHHVGGGLYSYWPVDYTRPIDKPGDWARSVAGVRQMAAMAANHGVSLGMEVLNRFEGYLLNTAAEAVRFVEEVGATNVGVMLDTFHMNIEEDSLRGAILATGARLSELHIGEPNRRPPGQGRFPWREIGEALHEIGYDGVVVMEPFVRMGGQVGSDIKVWRDMLDGEGEERLDRDVAESVVFIRHMFEANVW